MRSVLFLLLLSMGGCQADETVSGQTDASDVWVLTKMGKTSVDTRITLTFPEKGKIAGQAPCNRYFASQTAPLPWFETGPIGATKRGCAKLNLEKTYFETLNAATLVEIQGNVLILSDDQKPILEFTLN